jgi:FKBP-type peptidyl-prolyl cis-trans isomerase FkpA
MKLFPFKQLPNMFRFRLFSGLLVLTFSMVLSGCSNRPSLGPNVMDDDAPKEFTKTPSGLQYRILRRGSGDCPTAGSRVKVDYLGTLENGVVFDESYNQPSSVEFSLGNVVPGWTEGMQLINPGGMIELVIPPELGYGSRGAGKIPPDSTLRFQVELHSFR